LSAPGCGAYLLFAAALLWVVFASAIVQGLARLTQQLFEIMGSGGPGALWVLPPWGQALVVGLPAVLLAVLSTEPRLKGAYTAWSFAALFLLPLSLVRAFPATWNQPAALSQAGLALLFALAVALVLRARGRLARGPAGGRGLALALAALGALPFLLWGALGSPLDTLLNLLAGLGVGLAAALVLDGFLFWPLAAVAPGRLPDVLFGGLAAAGALAIMGSGFGVHGQEGLLLLVLAPLGLAAGAVARAARPWSAGAIQASVEAPREAPVHRAGLSGAVWPALTLLIGLAAAAVLALVDPDELTLILGDADILAWATRAAWSSVGLSLLVGLLASAIAAAAGPRAGAARSGRGLAGLAAGALVWVLALAVYAGFGQPGLHGERLFVILAEQADVSAAYAIPDRLDRLTYVYTTLVGHAGTTQAGLRRLFDRLGLDYQPYYLVNAIEVDGGPLLRAYLSLQPEVDRIIPSPRLRPLPRLPAPGEGESTRPPDEPRWNLTSIGADRVWQEFGATGQGIIVGQSDSGVQGDHPALAPGYRGLNTGHDYNWYDPWYGTRVPTDIGGHGTHTLGSAVGRLNIGVAPGAEWFGCVNLARNLANPALYLDCMQFMLAPFPQQGDPLRDGDPARAAHVLNNSWGCPPLEGCDPASLGPAVAALRAAGIFVVASAGNEGPACGSVRDPIAIYPEAFSVGAIDRFGGVAGFSSRGPVTVDGSGRMKPDIAAPGVDIFSSLPGGTYGPNQGTSMAGPHVAGAVALLWSADPALIGDMDRTEQILRQSARPHRIAPGPENGECDDGPAPNNGVGYGLLDVYAAVQMALER
jgi:subtilisin family serine protease